MSKTIFDDHEAAQIAVEFTRNRIADLAKNLRELRDRELKKGSKPLIAPNSLNAGGTNASGGTEGVKADTNPQGKNDAMKAAPKMEESSHRPEETSAKVHEVLCKECGKAHDLEKGCDPMGKAMLKDSKGKVKDNGIHPDSVLPEDADSEEVSADGSGGDIKKGKAVKKSQLAKGWPQSQAENDANQAAVGAMKRLGAQKGTEVGAQPIPKGSVHVSPTNPISQKRSTQEARNITPHTRPSDEVWDARPVMPSGKPDSTNMSDVVPKQRGDVATGLGTSTAGRIPDEAEMQERLQGVGGLAGLRTKAKARASSLQTVPQGKSPISPNAFLADADPDPVAKKSEPELQKGIISDLIGRAKGLLPKKQVSPLTSMPKLKDQSKKQGYYGEHEEQGTVKLPEGATNLPIAATNNNPNRPPTRDEAKPDSWKPGHNLGGKTGLSPATELAKKSESMAKSKGIKPVIVEAATRRDPNARALAEGKGGKQGAFVTPTAGKRAADGHAAAHTDEESEPSGKPKYTGPRQAGDPNMKKIGPPMASAPTATKPPAAQKPAAIPAAKGPTPAKSATQAAPTSQSQPDMKLGEKDPAKQHALDDAWKAKNQKPASPKLPPVSDHKARAETFANFTPPGKFAKKIDGGSVSAPKVPPMSKPKALGAVTGDVATAPATHDKLMADAKATGKAARLAQPAKPLANPKVDPSK